MDNEAQPQQTWTRGTYPDSKQDAQAECKELTAVIVGALASLVKVEEDKIKALDELRSVLANTDPNSLRAHSCGTGNAIHQTLRLVGVHVPNILPRVAPILEVLIEHGARMDSPCEDYEAGSFLGKYDSLFDWVCGAYDRDDKITDLQAAYTATTIKVLLDAGAGWGNLDLRDDPVGMVVRGHEAWRRYRLGNMAGKIRSEEKGEKKPKI